MDIKILRIEDKDRVLAFEKSRLEKTVSDPMEREFAAWHSKGRQESLEFYLPLGWSFGAFDEKGALIGYLLAQPLMFFDGFTQTLWVEFISSDDDEVISQLAEVIYRWGRDKHLQKVIYANGSQLKKNMTVFANQELKLDLMEAKTTKFK